MGRFTEDMGRLRDEIQSDRIARQTLIADTRQEVTDAAHAFISDLKSNVESLQANFRDQHADMAEAARADRNAFLARLGGAVADIRVAAASRQASVREALAQSAAESRSARDQAAVALRDDVARMQDGFRHARGVMAMDVRAAGQSFVSGIVHAVADIQQQTQQLVGDFAGERHAARQAWRGEPTKPAAPPPPAVSPKAAANPAPKAQHKAAAHKEPAPKPAEKPMPTPIVTDAAPSRAQREDVSED
ncbi:hypothetical protein [uncultured Lamprocystis sp.]|jgi:hypothetical protein|uniref:hypothetical protein n=1 Tax=uncultured Lamprocystis sp. TaxID=543132 RepID=UPI0025E82C74|nr:hypothetical protein [uncultured Lamprocystis sp.]